MPVIILSSVLGKQFFLSLITFTSFVSAYECAKILHVRNVPSNAIASGAVSAIIVLLIPLAVNSYGHTNSITGILLTAAISQMIWMLFYPESTPMFIRHVPGILGPALYTGGILSIAVLIRESSHGLTIIFYLIILTSASDSGAYFVGKTIGRTPFFSKVSPNKTCEGAIGGLLFSLLGSILFSNITQNTNLLDVSLYHSILIGTFVGIVGQIGDLYESSLKRNSQIKDSGTIIPGHGGVLDRIDSVIFNIPVLYYSMQWLIT